MLVTDGPLLIAVGLGFLVVGGVALWLARRTPKSFVPQETSHSDAHFVNLDDEFRIHYVQKGSGPDLILIHGIGASHFCWRFLIPELSQHFRVTALDLPGFGHSSKPPHANYDLDSQTLRIKKFLDQLNIHQCFVMGCSMGGTLALWLAKAHPERVTKVIALAPATSRGLLPFSGKPLVGLAPFLHLGLNQFVMRLILHHVLGRGVNVDNSVLENYWHPYRHQPESVVTFLRSTEVLRDPRLPTELAGIQCPILLLWGTRDRMVKRQFMTDLCEVLAQVEFSEKEGGHHLMEDQPEWVLENAIRFFQPQTSL